AEHTASCQRSEVKSATVIERNSVTTCIMINNPSHICAAGARIQTNGVGATVTRDSDRATRHGVGSRQNQRCNRSSTTQGQRTITRDSTREGHVTLRVELTASPFHDEVVVDSNVPAVPLKGATIKINCVGRRVGA